MTQFQGLNYVQQTLRKKFGDLRIIEAKTPLRLQPVPQDAEGAEAKCPDNCILVHTAARMFGCKGAIFWKTSAYLDLLDDKGDRNVERFIVPAKTMRSISNFDHGIPIRQGCGLLLLPPKHSQTLKQKEKRTQRYNRQNRANVKASKDLGNARGDLRKAELQFDIAKEKRQEFQKILPAASPKVKDAIRQERAAKQALFKRRDRLDEKEKIAAEILSGSRNRKKANYFDLTTRNGAIGNYKFSA